MVVETKLYDLLEVKSTATTSEIKKAFHKKALVHHPDKGGDTTKFKEIGTAYEILSDEKKRRQYDQFGENGTPAPDISHLFKNIFGGGGGGGFNNIFGSMFRQHVQQPPPIPKNDIKITLEELYTGVVKKIRIIDDVKCDECKGKRVKLGGPLDQCGECKGKGVKIIMKSLGPGMFQQIHQPCKECNRTGVIIKPEFRCEKCSGSGIIKEAEIIDIKIPPGTLLKSIIKVDRKGGNKILHIRPVLKEPNKVFSIMNTYDLKVNKEISLKEALCGVNWDLKHLDTSNVKIESEVGEVIGNGSIKKVTRVGMPTGKEYPEDYGDLFVYFTVKFPEKLDTEIVNKLKEIDF